MPPQPPIQRRSPTPCQGLSVPELLVVLVIAALLFGAAAPGLSNLVASRRADAALQQLADAVQFTRSVAVTHRVTATLCPGRGDACGRRDSWHEGALVFLDADADSRLDADETVVRRLPPLAEGYRATWRSFRNRKSLSMKPTGLTDWQNGSMRVCPPDGDPRSARLLIVNAQGRIRTGTDADGDGIVEGGDGRPVAC